MRQGLADLERDGSGWGPTEGENRSIHTRPSSTSSAYPPLSAPSLCCPSSPQFVPSHAHPPLCLPFANMPFRFDARRRMVIWSGGESLPPRISRLGLGGVSCTLGFSLQKADHACTSLGDFSVRPSRFTFSLTLYRDPRCYHPTRSFSDRKPRCCSESPPVSACIFGYLGKRGMHTNP